MLKTIKIAKLYPDAKLPTRKHSDDAGLDLYYYNLVGSTIIPAGCIQILGTGVVMAIPKGYCGIIKPKSRDNILIGAGVVDAGYQGEILVKIVNTSTEYETVIRHGDAIAQILIIPVETPEPKEVLYKDIFKIESSRGATGGIVAQDSVYVPDAGDSDYGDHAQESWKQDDKFSRPNHQS